MERDKTGIPHTNAFLVLPVDRFISTPSLRTGRSGPFGASPAADFPRSIVSVSVTFPVLLLEEPAPRASRTPGRSFCVALRSALRFRIALGCQLRLVHDSPHRVDVVGRSLGPFAASER